MNTDSTDLPDCRFGTLVDRCDEGLDGLKRFLAEEHSWYRDLCDVAVASEVDPYGRRVLFDTPDVEVMVAQWTRGMPCAPHDHGGAVGAIRVLQGRARHRIWRVADGELGVVHEENATVGDVLACTADVIHSMADDGDELPLITLHMYTKSIDHMVVYDMTEGDTLVVDGACGAWVPKDQPEKIWKRVSGVQVPESLR